MGFSFETGMMIAFAVVAVWWLVMSLPLMKQYRQVHYVERKPHAMRESVGRIIETLRSVRKQKKIFLFLIAFFFFIDGVYTIIDMATAYGSALGLDSTGLLLALLVTQFVAFPFSILFGRLAEKYDTGKLILTCIAAYTGITVFAVFMKAQWQFWVLAIFVGMFQGGIQALSRSYFAKIVPPERSGEYFGLMDRSILYGNDGGRTGFPGFWEYKHRGIRYRISFPCRSTVFYENRAQWIGKYEKSGERYHGTADVP